MGFAIFKILTGTAHGSACADLSHREGPLESVSTCRSRSIIDLEFGAERSRPRRQQHDTESVVALSSTITCLARRVRPCRGVGRHSSRW
jgi:hypothetical protein